MKVPSESILTIATIMDHYSIPSPGKTLQLCGNDTIAIIPFSGGIEDTKK